LQVATAIATKAQPHAKQKKSNGKIRKKSTNRRDIKPNTENTELANEEAVNQGDVKWQ